MQISAPPSPTRAAMPRLPRQVAPASRSRRAPTPRVTTLPIAAAPAGPIATPYVASIARATTSSCAAACCALPPIFGPATVTSIASRSSRDPASRLAISTQSASSSAPGRSNMRAIIGSPSTSGLLCPIDQKRALVLPARAIARAPIAEASKLIFSTPFAASSLRRTLASAMLPRSSSVSQPRFSMARQVSSST